MKRARKRRPVLGLDEGGIEPLGKLRDPAKRIARDAVQEFLGEPEGKRINGLYGGQLAAFAWRQDIVGVRHLEAGAVLLHTARHKARLVERQEPFDGVSIAVEEDDIEGPAFILADDAQGRAVGPLSRRVVAHGLHHKRGRTSRHRLLNRRG